MSNRTMALGIAAVLLIGSAVPSQSQTPPVGTWTNELGSTLTIANVSSSGLLTGTYVTNVGCSAGVQQPITGWYYPAANGGAITFSVYWNGCNSLASWSGQMSGSGGTFTALWYLTLAGPPAWNGINAGTDTFTLVGFKK
jgi:avidin family protein